MDGSRKAPQSIATDMPGLAEMLRKLEPALGKDPLQRLLKSSVALRKAVDADDFDQVNAIYRLGHGSLHWIEGDFEFGVGEDEMRAFAERHRAARKATR